MQQPIFYRKDLLPSYQVSAKEVVKVLNDTPHLVVRITISGGYFPHRAPHPFIHIKVGESKYFVDYYTEISNDNTTLIGYLPVDVPERGVIEFGYENEIWGTIPGEFTATSIPRLDRKRLPDDLVVVDEKWVSRFKGPQIETPG